MSRATVTLPNELLDELMAVVSVRTKTEAVVIAVRDEIRLRRMERIRSMAGKASFEPNARAIRNGDRRLG